MHAAKVPAQDSAKSQSSVSSSLNALFSHAGANVKHREPSRVRHGLVLAGLVALSLGGCATYAPPTGIQYPPGQDANTPPQYPQQATQVQNQPAQVVRSLKVPQSSLPGSAGLSVAEILTQIKGGKPPADLVNELREKGLNAPLKQADVDLLAANSVPKEVVDAALAAPVNTVSVESPQQVTRSYYHYPWVPFTLGLYWGSTWRPYHYPYYSYAPRHHGYAAPRIYGPSPSYRHSLPSSGWGGRGGRWR